MTQRVVFRASGAGGFIKGSFEGVSLATVNTSSRKSSGVITSRGNEKAFNLAVGTYPMKFSLIPVSGGGITLQIFNNGNRIFSESSTARAGKHIDQDLIVEALDDVTLPTPEPEVREDDCFIFANIFRMQGSTAEGADPQQKVLVSSGRISCESADALRATGHIIEEIGEGAVAPPEIAPVTPQAPFFIKNGVKVQITPQDAGRTIKITIKENLGFREV